MHGARRRARHAHRPHTPIPSPDPAPARGSHLDPGCRAGPVGASCAGGGHLADLEGQRRAGPELTARREGRPDWRGARLRVLRRAALRHGPAPLRAHPARHDQGHHPQVLHHARLRGRASLRLGLSRPAHRVVGGRPPRRPRRRRRRAARHRPLQRRLPLRRAGVHRPVACDRGADGALGRLRQRLQDHGPFVHGVGVVGVSQPVGPGVHLRGLPGAARLAGPGHAPFQLRGGARTPGARPGHPQGGPPAPAGPRDHRALQAGGRGRLPVGLDHHPLDSAEQPGPGRPPRADLRQGARAGHGRGGLPGEDAPRRLPGGRQDRRGGGAGRAARG